MIRVMELNFLKKWLIIWTTEFDLSRNNVRNNDSKVFVSVCIRQSPEIILNWLNLEKVELWRHENSVKMTIMMCMWDFGQTNFGAKNAVINAIFKICPRLLALCILRFRTIYVWRWLWECSHVACYVKAIPLLHCTLFYPSSRWAGLHRPCKFIPLLLERVVCVIYRSDHIAKILKSWTLNWNISASHHVYLFNLH